MSILISKATFADLTTLASLGSSTFFETYFNLVPERSEIIRAYVDEAFSMDKLTSELSENNTQYYIVRNDNLPIGYAKTLRENTPIEIKLKPSLHHDRIYIQSENHKKGFGKTIFKFLRNEAVKSGYQSIWLGVFELNVNAVEFYKKMGFKQVGEQKFSFDHNGQTYSDTDWIFECALS